MTPDLLTQLTQSLLDCACSALEKTQCGCPARAFTSVGAVAWDQCCESGQLWVGVDRIYAYGTFPAPATGALTCAPPLAADIVISVLRCAPVMNDQGEAPTAEALSLSAAAVLEDAYTLETAVLCCLSEHGRERPFAVGNLRPLGPTGGCTGVELRLTVALVDPPPAPRI